MRFGTIIGSAALVWLFGSGVSEARVRIVASTTDLASIAEWIGGDRVTVDTICRGSVDPHFIQLLPSYMVKVSQADVYLKVGMDLDFWADRIIDGSENDSLLVVDCSHYVDSLEVSAAQMNASSGDVHTRRNPHYWLDPTNGIPIAEAITEALKRVDPDSEALYAAGLESFKKKLGDKLQEWRTTAAPLHGKEIVTYHNSWPYFARFTGIVVAGFVEPKPGIEPSPSHTAELIALVKARGITVIGKEPYISDRAPKSIASQTNARIVNLPTSVGSVGDADDYFALFDVLIATLSEALAK